MFCDLILYFLFVLTEIILYLIIETQPRFIRLVRLQFTQQPGGLGRES